jgi:hypothetical protein
MPAEPLDPPEPRSSYSTYLLLHNILRLLAANDCEIVITAAENVGLAVRAARDLLRAFGIEPEPQQHVSVSHPVGQRARLLLRKCVLRSRSPTAHWVVSHEERRALARILTPWSPTHWIARLMALSPSPR